ncbi:MAG: hypothetical protein GY870_12430 [archaeon]|nr:hypothetical protein [archaeon]
MLSKLNNSIISTFGEDKVKWIKGIMAYFLIIVVTNFVSPFTSYINATGWAEVWITYTLIVINAGVMVLIAFIVFFLGKPIIPTVTPDIASPPELPIPEAPEIVPEEVEAVIPEEEIIPELIDAE